MYSFKMILGLWLLAELKATASKPASIANIPMKFGTCENPVVEPGFKVNEFFHNKWYTWKNTGNFFLGTRGSCTATLSNVNGQNIHLLHYQYEPILKKFVSIEGKAEKPFTLFKGLRFPVDYHLISGLNLSIPFSVVDTDYENWAVVYFCKQLFMSKIEMSWILLRSNDTIPSDEQLSLIERSLLTINSKMDDYELQDNSHCGQGEPKLPD